MPVSIRPTIHHISIHTRCHIGIIVTSIFKVVGVPLQVEGVPGGYIPRPAAHQAAAALQQSAALPAAQSIHSMYSQQPASHLPYVATAAPDLPYSRNPIMPTSAAPQQTHSVGFSAHLSPAEQQYSQTPVALRPSAYDQQQTNSSYGRPDHTQQLPSTQRFSPPPGAASSAYMQNSPLSAKYDQPQYDSMTRSSGTAAYGSNGQQPLVTGGPARDNRYQLPPHAAYPAPAAVANHNSASGGGFAPSAAPSAAEAKKATYRYGPFYAVT